MTSEEIWKAAKTFLLIQTTCHKHDLTAQN